MMKNLVNRKSSREEIANTITHGVGLGFAIAAVSVLVVFASLRGTAWHIVSCSIYGGTLVILYLASTLYHWVQSPVAKRLLKIFDHCSIYLLIAGSYTPFTIVSIQGGWGWTLFGLIWGMAILGIVFKTFHTGKYEAFSTMLYLAMGWIVIIAIKPLFASIPLMGFLWIVAGGLLYTFGVLFYCLDRIPFFHAIWHVFVLGGSACHFFAVLFYVLPPV